LTLIVVLAAIIGMFFIVNKTYMYIINNYEEYFQLVTKLLEYYRI